MVPISEPTEATVSGRDSLASWSTYISYINAKGELSERRITCHHLEGFGRPEVVRAYCHESKQPKSFRIDRIQELIDYVTGQVADPREHFEQLHLLGLIPMQDKALAEVFKALVFMARCDGQYHPLEDDAIEHALGRYVLRFGGSDEDIRLVLMRSRALAPDGTDFVHSLRKIARSPERVALAALVLESCANVIDADGRHAPEEIQWGLEASDLLKEMARQS